MKKPLLSLVFCLIYAVFHCTALLASDYTWQDEEKWCNKCRDKIMSNYHGPSLSSIKESEWFSNFIVSGDGTVKWIYHSLMPVTGEKYIPSHPEIQKSIDEAVKLSSPLPKPFLYKQKSVVCWIGYTSNQNPPMCVWVPDHPGLISPTFNEENFQLQNNKWASSIIERLLQHLDLNKLKAVSAWGAYWFRLDPDGTIDEMEPVPVRSGKKNNYPAARQAEKQLKNAIVASKTFLYDGAPVAPNQPEGVVVIYRPNSNKLLGVMTFWFDRPPDVVVWGKKSIYWF